LFSGGFDPPPAFRDQVFNREAEHPLRQAFLFKCALCANAQNKPIVEVDNSILLSADAFSSLAIGGLKTLNMNISEGLFFAGALGARQAGVSVVPGGKQATRLIG